MNFWDFLANLNLWQMILFWIFAIIWIEITLNMIFKPITKRLDTLNDILKNVEKIVFVEKQKEKPNDCGLGRS